MLLFLYFDKKIKPQILNACNFEIKQFASNKLSDAITSATNQAGFDYTDYVNLKTSDNSSIIAIKTNAKKITEISNAITKSVNTCLKNIDSHTVSIRLGSLSGLVFLSGRGPKIPIKITSKGISNSEIVSKLEEAGINQTIHRIRIIVTADIIGYFAGLSTSVKVKSDCVLAECLIVGMVPNNYTKIEPKTPAVLKNHESVKSAIES